MLNNFDSEKSVGGERGLNVFLVLKMTGAQTTYFQMKVLSILEKPNTAHTLYLTNGKT